MTEHDESPLASKYGRCRGCEQEIDPEISHHFFDGDNGLDEVMRFHIDCCPGKHVTGTCGQTVVTDEDEQW